MGAVSQNDLKRLFERIDSRLTRKTDLCIIGGASAILGYNIVKETNDVDLDGGVDPELEKLFHEEAKKLGLELSLSAKGVFSPPDGYRERTKFYDFPNRRLRVWYLGQYDLAISKIDRGIQKDFDDILSVHRVSPYDLDKLIEIFNSEYIAVSAIGNPREKKMNLLDLAGSLFGQEAIDATKSKIRF